MIFYLFFLNTTKGYFFSPVIFKVTKTWINAVKYYTASTTSTNENNNRSFLYLTCFIKIETGLHECSCVSSWTPQNVIMNYWWRWSGSSYQVQTVYDITLLIAGTRSSSVSSFCISAYSYPHRCLFCFQPLCMF